MKKSLAVLLSLAFTLSLRAAVPPAENLLPSDTLFVLTIPDFNALRAATHQSPQILFWNSPEMKPFHDKFMGKLTETLAGPLEQNLGVKLADFADLPQGQLTLAVTQNGWTGSDDPAPAVVFLLDAGDKSGLLKTNLDALKKKWTDGGKTIRTEDVRGMTFSVVTLSSNDFPSLMGILPGHRPVQELGVEPKPGKPAELAIGQHDSLLIVGNSVKAVEPIAAHLSGSLLPALNDDAVFAADKLSQFRGSPLYYGWLNARTLFYVLAHAPQPEPNPEAPSPMTPPPAGKILDALGLMNVKSASISCRETRDGSQAELFIAAPESGRKGLLKIIASPRESSAPPVFVPADAVKFVRWRQDGQDAWAALEKMVGDISPAALAGLNSGIAMVNANAQKNTPGFDLRRDLIGNLGDDFINYQKTPSGKTLADVNNAPSIFLIGVQNGDRAVNAIKSLMSMSLSRQQKAPEPRDYFGHKIYSIPLPGPRVRTGTTTTRSLYLSSAGGYVALTTDVSTLEEYLRSAQKPPKPLSGTPGLVDAAQHVGGAGTGLFGYENQRETMRFLFKMLQNTDSAGGANPLAMMPQEVRNWVDFSLLPDYDKVSKYFYLSVFSGTATADGLSFKAFAPRPPEVK